MSTIPTWRCVRDSSLSSSNREINYVKSMSTMIRSLLRSWIRETMVEFLLTKLSFSKRILSLLYENLKVEADFVRVKKEIKFYVFTLYWACSSMLFPHSLAWDFSTLERGLLVSHVLATHSCALTYVLHVSLLPSSNVQQPRPPTSTVNALMLGHSTL